MSYRLQTGVQSVVRFGWKYLFAGDAVVCSLCSWRGKLFLKGQCPKCKSLARHRLIPYSIRHFGLNLAGGIVFHAGGNPEESRWISSQSARFYVRFDIRQSSRHNLAGDLREIPLALNSVDFILIWHVLEHIPQDRRVIQEMFRIMKPGGHLLASVPLFPAQRQTTYEDPGLPPEKYLEVFGHNDHVRACGFDYQDRFWEAGFFVQTLLVRSIDPVDTKKYGLNSNHVAWCCSKVKP